MRVSLRLICQRRFSADGEMSGESHLQERFVIRVLFITPEPACLLQSPLNRQLPPLLCYI